MNEDKGYENTTTEEIHSARIEPNVCEKCAAEVIVRNSEEIIKELEKEHKCLVCGTPMKMDIDPITKKESKYLWKFQCNCVPKNIRLAVL